MDSQRRCRRGQRLCCKGLANEPTLLFGSLTERFAELFRPSPRRWKFRQQRTFDAVAVGEHQKDVQYTIGSGLTSIRINGDDRKVIVSTIPPSKFFGVEPSIMSCSGELLYSVYAHDNVFGRRLTGTESRLPNSRSQEASFILKIGLAGNRPKANNEFGKNALFASMAIAATVLMLGVARPGSYFWLHRRMFPEKVDACVPKLVEGGIIGSKIYVPKTTKPCFAHSESFLSLPTAASSSARLIDPEDVGRSTRDFRSLTSIQEDFEDSPSVIKDHSAGDRARAA